MTKDIMLRISGVQFPDGEENSEEMEVITSGMFVKSLTQTVLVQK